MVLWHFIHYYVLATLTSLALCSSWCPKSSLGISATTCTMGKRSSKKWLFSEYLTLIFFPHLFLNCKTSTKSCWISLAYSSRTLCEKVQFCLNLLFESGVESAAAFGTFFAPRCMHWLDSLKVVLIYGLLPNQVVAHNNALTKKKCLKITVPLNEYEW